MPLDHLSTIVALLAALSVASERLVEIIKGVIPFLSSESKDPGKERWRRVALQLLAVAAGIATAFLARPAIAGTVTDPWSSGWGILALGLLASGGSGFWNAMLSYVTLVKDIKRLEKRKIKKGLAGELEPTN